MYAEMWSHSSTQAQISHQSSKEKKNIRLRQQTIRRKENPTKLREPPMKKMNPSAQRKSQKPRRTSTILIKTLIWSKSWGLLVDPPQMRWRTGNPIEQRKKLTKFLARLSTWVSMGGRGQTKKNPNNPLKKKMGKSKKNNESEEDEKAFKLKPLETIRNFLEEEI